MSAVLTFLRARTIYALILLLVLFVVGVELVRPGTVTPLWASNTILFAAPLAIIGGGQTMVMLTGGIDLSVASVATGAAYLLATNASLGALPAIGLALLLGAVVGIVNGIGVALLRVQPLVMTLGAGLMTGGVMIVYSQHMMASQPHVPEIIQTLGAGKVLGLVPVDLFLWLVIGALILFGLQRTGFGRLLYAVGDNREACHLAGVRVWRVLFANYLICAILAAITGLVLVGGTNAADLSLADSYLLPSVACVVIGGTSIFGGRGGYSGTIVGALDPDRPHRPAHAARRFRADQADPLRSDHPLARRGLCAPDGMRKRPPLRRGRRAGCTGIFTGAPSCFQWVRTPFSSALKKRRTAALGEIGIRAIHRPHPERSRSERVEGWSRRRRRSCALKRSSRRAFGAPQNEVRGRAWKFLRRKNGGRRRWGDRA